MKKIRADVLVHQQGLSKSRELAKRYIMAGKIYVKETRVEKPGQLFDEDTEFKIKGPVQKYVSRAGYKLEKAIDVFEIDLSDKICADFGASTGGFTDCMLQNKAKKVYAIDVGYGQLDYKLRTNPNVVVIEKTNIRTMDTKIIQDEVSFISIDVSFISLELILPKAFDLLEKTGQIVGLIKPQFEAGRDQVGKGGIVKDKNVHRQVIEKILAFVSDHGHCVTDLTISPIKGSHGNVEYLILIEEDGTFVDESIVEDVIRDDKRN